MSTATRRAEEWDAVVVGAGLAGSLVADRLAVSGARVLVLESGPSRSGASPAPGAGRWPGPIVLEGRSGHFRRAAAALLGHGPGGSSALYGAALERFEASDFDGTRTSAEGALSTKWPIGLGQMAPWYEEAEHRLGVGLEQPPISPRDHAIIKTLRGNGHAPYRLPVAIAYRPGCGECQGQRCARACKGEGWTRVLADTAAQHRVVIRCSTHVRTLAAEVDGMVRLDLAGPHRQSIRARRVVLAAGALNTPRLLLNSPDLFEREPHPMIGRGLMFHSSDLFTVGVSPGLASDGPKKTMALRDFYDLPEGRGGEIQSLGFDLAPRLVSRYLSELVAARGIPGGPYLMAALRIPATVMARWLGEPPVLATILEDLPYTENRVLAAPEAYAADQPIQVSYTVKPELEARAMAMRRAIGAAFAPMKVTFLLSRIAPNLGHPCGTVRMGDAPETDPVDAKGRLRGVAAQIYVADASVLPSSGGVNPGLTVAANALRIAEALTSGHALPQGAAGRWSNARAS